MDAFKLECPEAYAWLEEKPPNEWCRAFFSDFVKCDVLTNNSCEVFNKWILEARELPVLSMLENIACQIGNRYYKKQREAIEQCTGQVCPKIRQKIEKNTEYAANCRPRAYDPRLDPMNDTSSMISQLGCEAPQIQIEEDVPFPIESAFVAARRSSIPTARVTTATREGVVFRGRGRNRSGRRRGVAAAAAAAASTAAASTSTTRGRGTGPAARGRGARGRGTGSAARGRGNGSAARGRGAGARGWEHLLFGDGHRQDNDAAQINNSQNAPFDMSQQ